MSEEKKEQKIDLKDRMLSDDDLENVSGGYFIGITCPFCGAETVRLNFKLINTPQGNYICDTCHKAYN